MLHRVEMIMGTAITVHLRAAGEPRELLEAAAEEAFSWFREVDQRFSTYKDDSEVCRLGRGALSIDAASADLRDVLEACEELRSATDGYFDAYAMGGLDPSGYVKGWSVQVASDRLLEAGIADHFINAGGDVRVRGTGDDGGPWRVGIAHPWEQRKVAWVVAGSDLAVATSGTYERGPHVVNPFSGTPSDALCSVTVTGADLGVADAYATAAVAMGMRGLTWLAGLAAYESSAITQDGQAFRSPGFPAVDPGEATPQDMPVY